MVLTVNSRYLYQARALLEVMEALLQLFRFKTTETSFQVLLQSIKTLGSELNQSFSTVILWIGLSIFQAFQ